MRNMWEKYYDDANAIIFVVDSGDIGRLDEAKLAYGRELIFAISIITFATFQKRFWTTKASTTFP